MCGCLVSGQYTSKFLFTKGKHLLKFADTCDLGIRRQTILNSDIISA